MLIVTWFGSACTGSCGAARAQPLRCSFQCSHVGRVLSVARHFSLFSFVSGLRHVRLAPGERFGEEAVSATSTLWDMIRESGTGAGDAVREVSEVGSIALWTLNLSYKLCRAHRVLSGFCILAPCPKQGYVAVDLLHTSFAVHRPDWW